MFSILKISIAKLWDISNAFSDLVLGPQPRSEVDANRTLSNHGSKVSIPDALHALLEVERWKGQIVEIVVSEPEVLEKFLDFFVKKELERERFVALLGVEKANWQQKKGLEALWVMPGENAAQMLFAAQELIKSKAVDVIVMQELLLKGDEAQDRDRYYDWLIGGLEKLKREVLDSETLILLANPATSERKRILSELQLICSHQFELMRYEAEKDEIKDRY